MNLKELFSNQDKLVWFLSQFRRHMKPDDFNKTLAKELLNSMESTKQDEIEVQREDHQDNDERESDSDGDSKCIILKIPKMITL